MKRIRYKKYDGDLASEIDLEDLLQSLSDYFLDSGFRDPYSDFQELDHNFDDLREALRRLLEEGDLFDDEMQRMINALSAEGKLDELVDKLIQRLENANYISSSSRARQQTRASQAGGEIGDVQGEVRFEVTDKSL